MPELGLEKLAHERQGWLNALASIAFLTYPRHFLMTYLCKKIKSWKLVRWRLDCVEYEMYWCCVDVHYFGCFLPSPSYIGAVDKVLGFGVLIWLS